MTKDGADNFTPSWTLFRIIIPAGVDDSQTLYRTHFFKGQGNTGSVWVGHLKFDIEMTDVGGEMRRRVENIVQGGVFRLCFIAAMWDH